MNVKRSMNKAAVCAAVALCLCFSQVGLATPGITMEVYASSAPNAAGAASWAGYVTNALYALENGLSVNGDITTNPSAYERAGDVIDAGDIAVTSFKSWRGQVNPAAPFQNELGNRVHFGLHILGNGTQFSISQLSFVMASDDATNTLGWSYATGTYGYSAEHVGIQYGIDGVKGGGDDIRITSGANTQLVDELVSRGSGNAWWPGGDLADRGVGDPQAAMDEYNSWIASVAPINFSGMYTLAGVTGSDMVTVIPEPATAALLALGGLALIRRRRLA